MTETEARIATELSRCSFFPGGWDKLFCRDMAFVAEHSREVRLSDYQNANLLRLVWKYRRQLPTAIVELALDEMERNADRRVAEGLGALPAFSKPQPARKVKAEPVALVQLPLFDGEHH